MNARISITAAASPFSLGAQARALMAAVAAVQTVVRTQRPLSDAERKEASSAAARAAALRRAVLHTLTERAEIAIHELPAAHPGTTRGQWAWLLSTLTDAGLLQRKTRQGNRPYRYRITDAGRQALASQTHPHLIGA